MKMSEYMIGREDGLILAYNIVKDGGIETLEKEIKFRNTTKIRTPLAKKDLEKALIPIKERLFDTVMTLSVATLHDKFGYGKKRCQGFIERFEKKTLCLMDDLATFDDYTKVIKEELGIVINIRNL